MSNPPALNGLFGSHTFGKAHAEPQPLSASMQQDSQAQTMQMMQASSVSGHAYMGDLPHDFDHIVRSIGEW